MKCEDYQIFLNRDLDGVLGAEDEKRLSAHAAGCPKCGADRASSQAIHGAFRDLRHADVPAGLADRIIEQATAPRAPIFRIPRYAMIPVAASVLGLCLISGALGWRLKEPGTLQAHERLDEAQYREFLTGKLSLPVERVDSILKLRRTFDQRFKSEETELKARIEKLQRQEVEEIWKLLPPDAQDRYRKHDPAFTPPATSPR